MITAQVLYSQLMVGLINGSFYALLSLGLAVIFGMLNIVNFAHGAFYMVGAFVAYFLLQAGINYWGALILSPIIVGLLGAVVERTLLKRIAGLDHLYGLLLTFGLALVIQGLFQNEFGSSGKPYPAPAELRGPINLGFMYLPMYRGWVIIFSVVVCFAIWFAIEKTKLGAYLRAATENPTLVRAFGINVPLMITATYGFGVGARGARRRARRADQSGPARHGRRHHRRRVRGRRHRRHGLDPGLDPHRLRARRHRGPDEGVLSRSLQHGRLRHHGDRADHPPLGAVRKGRLR